LIFVLAKIAVTADVRSWHLPDVLVGLKRRTNPGASSAGALFDSAKLGFANV
jgi:hypothetical protein